MEATDSHNSEATPALQRRDEPEAYEPPSVTELGSFRDLTGTAPPGKGQGGSDSGSASNL
jgi:hypothetical protein